MIDIKYEMTDAELDMSDVGRQRSQWHMVIDEFEKTSNKMVVIKTKNADDKRRCASAVRNYLKHENRDYTVYVSKSKNEVYIVRAVSK